MIIVVDRSLLGKGVEFVVFQQGSHVPLHNDGWSIPYKTTHDSGVTDPYNNLLMRTKKTGGCVSTSDLSDGCLRYMSLLQSLIGFLHT